MTGEVGDVDLTLVCIMWFANAIAIDHLVKDCLKEIGETTRKVGLNLKKGMAKKGDWSSQKLVATHEATLGNAPQA